MSILQLASYRSEPSSFFPTDTKRWIICFTCSAGIARINLFLNETDAGSIFKIKIKRKKNNTMVDPLKSKRDLDELIALSSELRSLLTEADRY